MELWTRKKWPWKNHGASILRWLACGRCNRFACSLFLWSSGLKRHLFLELLTNLEQMCEASSSDPHKCVSFRLSNDDSIQYHRFLRWNCNRCKHKVWSFKLAKKRPWAKPWSFCSKVVSLQGVHINPASSTTFERAGTKKHDFRKPSKSMLKTCSR